MSAHMKFGEVLRTARERKGIDLSTAARKLRIRPDILSAIEQNDISRMPPRGYSRNMVNAYARLLGLNPTEITKLYLDEAYAYQVGRARDDARTIGTGVSIASTRREARRQTREEDRAIGDGRTSALGRRQYSDARTDEYFTSSQAPAYPRSRRGGSIDHTHPSRGTALPNAHYTNFYAGPAAPSGIRSKLPFIIGAIVILLLLILVLVLAFGGNRNAASTNDTPTVPITGIDDPEANSSESETGDTTDSQTTTTKVVEPTSVTVTYSIASGAAPWIEISQDGTTTVAEQMNGPAEETFDVTGTATIGTAQPDYVTVLIDGQAAQFSDDDGDGFYTVTIDFNTYLDSWREANGVSGTSSSANASSNSGSSSSASTDGRSSTGTSTGTGNSSSSSSGGSTVQTVTSSRTSSQ